MILRNVPQIPLANPTFDKEMEKAALNALRNERFVLGEDVYKFEEEFARYCRVKYAVSTSSGTDALHLSIIALGVGEQDRVVTTSFSFVATANVILHVGATPIFADINANTYNVDPDQIRRKITKHTKAIIPVHLYGYPSDMERIMEIAEDHEVRVLEDACQAHGAEYRGSKTGAIGDVGCFSFYPSKNMTVCGDGGMVTTNNEEVAEVIGKLRDCGRKAKYVHDVVGYTTRLNTVNAAIGRIQLKKLDGWNEKRRRNAALYDELLSDLDEVVLPPAGNSYVKPVHHLYVIRVKKRDELKKWLEDNGIQCGIHYPLPIHLQPIYRQLFKFKGGEYPQSERVSNTCLSIPMYPNLTTDEIRYISEKIHEFYDKICFEE
jgi:perosamine synthetase